MSRSMRHRLTVYAAILIGLAIYYPFSPGGRQMKNLWMAEQSIPKVKGIVAQDVRFARVRGDRFTGNGGCLLISGWLTSEEDFKDLRSRVTAECPDLKITWRIFVTSPITNGINLVEEK